MMLRLACVTALCATTAASPAPIYGIFNGYGECVMDAVVNGKPMQFIADIGADELYLSRHQAYQLGFDPLKADDIETDDFGDRTALFTVSFQIGNFSDPALEAIVEIKDHEVDPVMGRSVLSHFNFQMSAKSCELDPQ
jgi:predicted aspartyl protease